MTGAPCGAFSIGGGDWLFALRLTGAAAAGGGIDAAGAMGVAGWMGAAGMVGFFCGFDVLAGAGGLGGASGLGGARGLGAARGLGWVSGAGAADGFKGGKLWPVLCPIGCAACPCWPGAAGWAAPRCASMITSFGLTRSIGMVTAGGGVDCILSSAD